MKKIDIIKKIVFILVVITTIFTFQQSIKVNNTDYLEVIRKVNSEEEAYFLARKYDLTLIDISPHNIVKYKIDQSISRKVLNEGFYVNNSFTKAYTPRDPYYQYQDELVDTKINQVWNHTLGDGVVVAIIDTGIVASNLEFKNSISSLSYNSVTRKVGIIEVNDDDGHGTSVASILAANHNNNKIAGIAPNAEIMVIKANTINEEQEVRFSEDDLIEAIYYAVDNGADIINMSLGGKYSNQLTQDAVNYAYENQVIIVAAAGNDGDNSIIYPAAYNNVISVAATNKLREIADFSVFNEYVDISAPGVDIVNITMDNRVVKGNGTSFAAPIISGVLALLKSGYPNDDIDKLTNKLYLSAVDINIPGKDIYSGHGYVDAYSGYIYDLYKVTFLNYDDIVLKEQYVSSGDSVIYEEIPIKPETEKYIYEFIGWDNDFSVIKNDLVIRPIFNSMIKNYTYTFYDGNTILKKEVTSYGSEIIAPTVFSKESTEMYDYVFVGWNPTFYEESIITRDVSYYAVYIESLRKFTVNFYDYSNDLVKSEQIVYGNSASDFSLDNFDDEKYDYLFVKWNQDFNYVTEDLLVKAIFDKQVKVFTLNYYDYFGNILETENIEYGYSGSITNIETLLDNQYIYEFIAWDQDIINITANLEIYPLFNKNMRKYKITFVLKDITIDKELYFEDIPLIDFETDISGYDFLGWDKDIVPVSKDEVFTASYTVKTYIVKFFDEEILLDEFIVNYNDSLALLPPLPQKEGYNSQYEDINLNEIKEDLIVNVIYSPKTYQVIITLEGNEIKNQIFNYGSYLKNYPEIKEKQGYDIIYPKTLPFLIKEDLILDISYQQSIFKVSYLDKFGIIFKSDNVLYGEKAIEYSLEDDKFIGWYLSDQKFDFTKPIYEDIILRPKYKNFGCITNIAYNWFGILGISLYLIRKRKI